MQFLGHARAYHDYIGSLPYYVNQSNFIITNSAPTGVSSGIAKFRIQDPLSRHGFNLHFFLFPCPSSNNNGTYNTID